MNRVRALALVLVSAPIAAVAQSPTSQSPCLDLDTQTRLVQRMACAKGSPAACDVMEMAKSGLPYGLAALVVGGTGGAFASLIAERSLLTYRSGMSTVEHAAKLFQMGAGPKAQKAVDLYIKSLHDSDQTVRNEAGYELRQSLDKINKDIESDFGAGKGASALEKNVAELRRMEIKEYTVSYIEMRLQHEFGPGIGKPELVSLLVRETVEPAFKLGQKDPQTGKSRLDLLREKSIKTAQRMERIKKYGTNIGVIGGAAVGVAGGALAEGAAGFLSVSRAKELGVDLDFIDGWSLMNLMYRSGEGNIAINAKALADLFNSEDKSKEIFSKYPKLCDALLKIDDQLAKREENSTPKNITCGSDNISYDAETTRGKVRYVVDQAPSGTLRVRDQSQNYFLLMNQDPNGAAVWTGIEPGKGFVQRTSRSVTELGATFLNNESKCKEGDLEPGPKQNCLIGEDAHLATKMVLQAAAKCREDGAKARPTESGGSSSGPAGQKPSVR